MECIHFSTSECYSVIAPVILPVLAALVSSNQTVALGVPESMSPCRVSTVPQNLPYLIELYFNSVFLVARTLE
jgi:hypothetical protein